jgi:chemotaxis protein MotB
MSAHNDPIMIKKKVHGHGGHHGGAWKVAYADFVTAMMAFFLVMWLVTQSKAVKQSVGGYFRDPGVFEYQRTHGLLVGGNGVDENSHGQGVKPSVSEMAALQATAVNIRMRLNQVPELKELGKQIELTVTPDGLRIDLLEADKSSFFASGSALLRPETERILGVIAREVSTLPNGISIEGHTDSHQYATTDGYTNWELSSDRANAARRAMDRQGLKPSQLTSVRGLADREPRVPSNPLDPRNRRVSILVKSGARVVNLSKPEAAAPVVGPKL